MNPANATSAPVSGTTSASGPAATKQPVAKNAASSASESEYLQQQADAAKAAISGAFAELKADLAKGADPRVWIQSHPWITLASAAVAGFAVAATVVPSKEQQALRRLQAIEEAMHATKEAASNGNGANHGAKRGPGSILTTILHELLAVMKPAIIGLISAYFSPKAPPAEPESANSTPDLRDVS